MAQTYTSQWLRVSNGDVTTHNPQMLASTSNEISVVGAEIQWEGITTETSGGAFSYETAPSPSELPITQSGDIPPDASNVDVNGLLDVSSGTASVQLVLDSDDDGIGEETATLTDSAGGGSSTSYFGDQYGEVSITAQNYSDDDGDAVLDRVQVYITYDTSTTSKTTDPRVTRDVSADSGSLTLNDSEQSSWYQLDGLAPDNEEFYHDISGSGEARFRFRFDWEKAFPDAVKQLRIYDNDADTKRVIALADPSDSQLLYNAIRTYEQQAGQVLAVDVTDDPSDASAITSHRLYHPTHGTLYLRYYDTVNEST